MKRTVFKLVVAATALGVLAAPHAEAASNITFTDDNVTRVFAGGSDTTYFALADLAVAYNGSEGCKLNAVAKPAVLQQNRCQGATVPEGLAQTGVVTTENYDHDLVINYFPQGSNAGRTQLCDQTSPRSALVPPVDFARSSNAPAIGFQCSGYTGTLRFIAFAKDALSWTHWNVAGGGGSTVTDLTVAQLLGIYNCSFTTWDQVGGANTNPINFYTAIPGSGTRSSWESFLGLPSGTSDACMAPAFKDGNQANGERVIREHYQEPVEQAVNDPAAANEGDSIYFISVGIHTVDSVARQNSLLGSVNGVAPTETTILDGSFAFGRFLFNVLRNTGAAPVASEAARRFTNMSGTVGSQGWLCKPHDTHSKPVGDPGAGIVNPAASQNYGALPPKILRKHGFIPLIPESNTAGSRCTFTDVNVVP